MISRPTAYDPGARAATARNEHERGQNAQIADKLRQVADILAAQYADPFRIAAYRRAAESIRVLNDHLGAIAEKGGREALEEISGHWHFNSERDHRNAGHWPVGLPRTSDRGPSAQRYYSGQSPGVGPALARRVYERLQVKTLEALEAAAHDERFQQGRGFGGRGSQ